MMQWLRAMRRVRVDVAPAYEREVVLSIVQQIVLAVLAALTLDMGETARGVLASIIGYWIGAVIVMVRRPQSPSKGDLLFVRWGVSILAFAFVSAIYAYPPFLGWLRH